jgi:hypothetical protein
MVLDTPELIEGFRLLQLKSALKLELIGIKMWRGQSAYARIKEEFKLRGSKQKVFDQFEELLKLNGVIK